MKRSNLAFLAVLAASVVAIPSTAAAQSPISFGFSAGAGAPMGDFGDAVDLGYNLAALVDFHGPAMPVALRVEGQWNEFGFSGLSSVKSRIMSLTANGVVSMGAVLSPYLIGGAGFYRTSVNGGGFSGSDNGLGLNVGAGIRLPLTGFSTYIEARYHKIMKDDAASYVPITFGIVF